MENEQIIKLILKYLNENNMIEVRNQLEKECGIKFEENLEDKLINFVNTSFNDLYLLNKSFKEILKIKNPIIIKLINILYLNQLYLMMDNLLPQQILSQIQFLVKELNDLKINFQDNIKLIEVELKKVSLILQDILTKNKQNIIKNFPEIETKEKVIEYIKKTISKTEQLTINNIFKIINLYFYKKLKNHNNPIYENNKKSGIPLKKELNLDLKNEVHNLILSNSQKYFCAILSNYSIITYEIQRNKNDVIIKEIIKFSSYPSTINQLVWNNSDTLILTASKDKTLSLFEPFTGHSKKKYSNIHASMITSCYFINDNIFISSGLDNKVYLVNVTTGEKIYTLNCEGISINELNYSKFIKSIIATVGTNNSLEIYSYNFNIEEKLKKYKKIQFDDAIISTKLDNNFNNKYLLVNHSKITPTISLFDLSTFKEIGRYYGHIQNRFGIKANFGGFNENFICCGSENGKINLWSKSSIIPIYEEKIHRSVVNEIIWPSKNEFKDILISGSEDRYINVFVNESIEKVYFLKGDGKLENKRIDVGNNEEKNIINNEPSQPNRDTAISIFNRINSLFRQLQSNFGGNSDDEEDR